MGVRIRRAIDVTIARARQLRRALSPPERRLWAILHGLRQRGYHFRRQHPIGPYYADFAGVKAGLVFEADGVTHTSEGDIAYDLARTEFFAAQGFKVVRIWNNDIMGNPDGVFAEIERALGAVPAPTPTPVPSPSEGGGRPRTRKLGTGLRDLAARTGEPVRSPSPKGGGNGGGGPRPPDEAEPARRPN